jgi:hypothetical protein
MGRLNRDPLKRSREFVRRVGHRKLLWETSELDAEQLRGIHRCGDRLRAVCSTIKLVTLGCQAAKTTALPFPLDRTRSERPGAVKGSRFLRGEANPGRRGPFQTMDAQGRGGLRSALPPFQNRTFGVDGGKSGPRPSGAAALHRRCEPAPGAIPTRRTAAADMYLRAHRKRDICSSAWQMMVRASVPSNLPLRIRRPAAES